MAGEGVKKSRKTGRVIYGRFLQYLAASTVSWSIVLFRICFFTASFFVRILILLNFVTISKSPFQKNQINIQKIHRKVQSLEFVICINALFDKLILFRNVFVMKKVKLQSKSHVQKIYFRYPDVNKIEVFSTCSAFIHIALTRIISCTNSVNKRK